MARPQKAGVEYFPLDVENDDKLDLVEAEFGLTGFAVVVKLYQRIYKLGYYCEWNDEVALLFGKRLRLGGSAVSEIVSAAIRRSLFDKGIYDSYGVLTSKGIQKRYFEIVARRKNVEVEQRYLLIPHALVPDNVRIMYAETPVNDDIAHTETPVNACKSTQSKVKESKVKKSKANDSNSPDARTENPFGDCGGERPSFDTVEAYATSNLKYMSPVYMEEMTDFKAEFTDDIIRYAIDKACEHGGRSWEYARRVLARCAEEGIKTLGAIKEREDQRRKARQAKASPPQPKVKFASWEEEL